MTGYQIRRVSIIAPMRNEARHIAQFARDVAAQDFDGAFDLIVADGDSDDGSVEILRAECASLDLPLTIVANPRRIVPTGLNECIRHSNADLLVRMDCHSSYPTDYVRKCVAAAEETGAWNVGGIVVPVGTTPMERAVATAMDSPFGGIGWTRHGDGTNRVEVDTVTFGAFRPEAFHHAGMFDEDFVRNQDDEFNLRLRRAGGRIVLDPTISVSYTPRGTWRGVFRQYYEYGLWKIPVMRKHHTVLGARSMAPIGLVGSVAGLAALAIPFGWARLVLAGELVTYAAAAGASALKGVTGRGEPRTLIPRVAATFPAFHLGYGLGMAKGLLRAALNRSPIGNAPQFERRSEVPAAVD